MQKNEIYQSIAYVLFTSWTIPLIAFLFIKIAYIQRFKEPLKIVYISLFFVYFLLIVFIAYASWNETLLYTYTWFSIAETTFSVSFIINNTQRIFLLTSSFITLLVSIYSLEYMKTEKAINRYFSLLGLFSFAMQGIIVSDNLLVLYMFLELISISSYFLIQFYHTKDAAVSAAYKALLINKIADLGLLISIFFIYTLFGTLEIETLYTIITTAVWNGQGYTFVNDVSISGAEFNILGICILFTAMGKSAQFPLSVWLPDAMEAPTPISALMHSATMVASGIFLLIKLFFIFTPFVLNIVVIISVCTIFVGCFSALFQTDIKKILAFSTISQLGFMMFSIGIAQPEASFFHLITHAFFKSTLFLAVGNIIHFLRNFKEATNQSFNHQDADFMGGLAKYKPFTAIAFIISSASLIGIPFSAGYFSKKNILNYSTSWADFYEYQGYAVVLCIFVASFITAVYMTRQTILIFFGKNRTPLLQTHLVSKTPLLFTIPILIMILVSILFSFHSTILDVGSHWFLQITQPLHPFCLFSYFIAFTPNKNEFLTPISILIVLSGIGIAIKWYLPNTYTGYIKKSKTYSFLNQLCFHHFYIQYVLHFFCVRPFFALSKMSAFVDKNILSLFIKNIGYVSVTFSHILYWIDRKIIDGSITLFLFFVKYISTQINILQSGSYQRMVQFSLFVFMIIIGMCVVVICNM